MRFKDAVDYGDAPTVFISGMTTVSLVSPNVIEIAYYRVVELPDGSTENRIVMRVLWDKDQWMAAAMTEAEARAAIMERARPPRQIHAMMH
jgi:hypothetical protein